MQPSFYPFLVVLSLRFFIFDFYLFKSIRNKLLSFNNYFITKLLQCSFCQGFWIGILYYVYFCYTNHIIFDYFLVIDILKFGFANAIVNFTWYASTDKLISDMEKKRGS